MRIETLLKSVQYKLKQNKLYFERKLHWLLVILLNPKLHNLLGCEVYIFCDEIMFVVIGRRTFLNVCEMHSCTTSKSSLLLASVASAE